MSEPVHQWPADTRECVFLARAASQLADNDLLWSGLRLGTLSARVYCVGRTDFWPIDLSPDAFLDADREQVLSTWQIEVRENDRRRPAAVRRAIPVPHWLYVTRSSLAKLEKARPAATTGIRDQAIKLLTPLYQANPKMKRSKAINAVAHLGIGQHRVFDAVKRAARKAADLPERARSGRPKSLQKSPR
jgi:hypothetical protein